MSKDEVLLDVKGVCLKLGESVILEDLSFQVVDRVREGTITGQVVGLLGPSGVGKTRLLRIIAGLDAPNQGHGARAERRASSSRGRWGSSSRTTRCSSTARSAATWSWPVASGE